jgi:hypothetical protein
MLYSGVKTLRSGQLVSLQFIVWIGIMFMFLNSIIDPSDVMKNSHFLFVLLVCIVGMVLAGCCFPIANQANGIYGLNFKHSKKYDLFSVKTKVLNFSTILYLLFVVYTGFYVVTHNGLTMVLIGGRTSSIGYDNGVNSSSMLIISRALEVLLYINISRLYKKGKKFLSFLLLLLPIIYLIFVSETRFDILAIFVSFLIFTLSPNNSRLLTFKHRKTFSYTKVFLLLCVGLLFSIVFMGVANMWRGGLGFGFDEIRSSGLTRIMQSSFPSTGSYFDYFYSVVDAVDRGTAKLEYGMNWVYYNIINFIPRAIWANKPITSINGRLTDLLFPTETAMCTFTMFGEGYVQIGFFGVLIESFIFLYSKYVVISSVSNISNSDLFRNICIINALTYTRSNAPVFEAIIYLVVIFVVKRAAMSDSKSVVL